MVGVVVLRPSEKRDKQMMVTSFKLNSGLFRRYERRKN